jgi:hypothetical protein
MGRQAVPVKMLQVLSKYPHIKRAVKLEVPPAVESAVRDICSRVVGAKPQGIVPTTILIDYDEIDVEIIYDNPSRGAGIHTVQSGKLATPNGAVALKSGQLLKFGHLHSIYVQNPGAKRPDVFLVTWSGDQVLVRLLVVGIGVTIPEVAHRAESISVAGLAAGLADLNENLKVRLEIARDVAVEKVLDSRTAARELPWIKEYKLELSSWGPSWVSEETAIALAGKLVRKYRLWKTLYGEHIYN